MRQAGIWIRNLGYDLLAVLHRKEKRLAVEAVWALLNIDTCSAYRSSSSLTQFVHVELDMPPGHLHLLVADEPPAGEVEEVRMSIPIYQFVEL